MNSQTLDNIDHLLKFYSVSDKDSLIQELVKHVEKLQDAAQRNVKPWEDTFPPTLLPSYIARALEKDIKLEDRLPAHKAALHINHNDHKSNYETAKDWIDEHSAYCDWENDAARQKAVDTDSVWTLHWYPETPVGFICLAAPTLEELLQFAAKTEE